MTIKKKSKALCHGTLIGDAAHNSTLLIQDGILISRGYDDSGDSDDENTTYINCTGCYITPPVYILTDIANYTHEPNDPVVHTIGPWSPDRPYDHHWLDLVELASDNANPEWQPLVAASITLAKDTISAVDAALMRLSSVSFPIIVRWGSLFIPERFTALMAVLHKHNRQVLIEAATTGQLLAAALTAKRYYTIMVSASLEAFFESDASYFITALAAGVIDSIYAVTDPKDSLLLASMIAHLNQLDIQSVLKRLLYGLPECLSLPTGFRLGQPADYQCLNPAYLRDAVTAKQANRPLPAEFSRRL